LEYVRITVPLEHQIAALVGSKHVRIDRSKDRRDGIAFVKHFQKSKHPELKGRVVVKSRIQMVVDQYVRTFHELNELGIEVSGIIDADRLRAISDENRRVRAAVLGGHVVICNGQANTPGALT